MTKIRTSLRALLDSAELALSLLRRRGWRREKSGHPRIAFQFFSLHLASFFEPLLARILQLDQYEVIFQILPHPHFTVEDREKLRLYAGQELGFPAENIRTLSETLWEPFDMVFYADTFALFPFRSDFNALLYHGIGTPKRFTERRYIRKSAHQFNAVYCGSHLDAEVLRDRGVARNGTRIHQTGIVLFDQLAHPEVSRQDFFQKWRFDPTLRTVVLAPHWSGLRHPNENIIRGLKETVEALTSLRINLLIKLHFMSTQKAVNRGRDWNRDIRTWVPGDVPVDASPDDVAALSYSDILITDVSSRGLIFAALGKPCILYPEMLLDHQNRERTLEQKAFELLVEVSAVAKSPKETRDQVIRALRASSPQPWSSEAIQKAGIRPSASPTERIISLIRSTCRDSRGEPVLSR